nr:helix-turn-helix domain-containing protein [Halosimplex salinum]
MVASVREDLERDMGCLDLLECIHGLNERDRTVFQILQRADDPLTVDDVADRSGCDRSTAYRSISRLLEAGVVVQRQVNYDDGGYYHVYRPSTPEEVARDMRRLLNDWYATVARLVQEFEHNCGRDTDERKTQSLQHRS